MVGNALLREIAVDGEVEAVAVGGVFRPFLVGLEILQAGLHLEDDDLTLWSHRHHVGAAAVRKRNFENWRQPTLHQHARDTARKRGRYVWAR